MISVRTRAFLEWPNNFPVRENQVPAACTRRSESGQLPLHTCTGSTTAFFRKEVIQPQVLLRLPCYDFTPIMSHTLDGCLSCELAHRLLVQPTFVM